MTQPSLPPLIAVIGCDGSGKSTVTQSLQEWLNRSHPAVICHLGKQSGNIGRQLARFPLIGGKLDKTIHSGARKAQTEKGPGLLAALIIYLFSMRRVRRFRRMMRLRKKGYLIVADRFPQLSVPGPMDGLGLANAPSDGLVGWLAKREKRHYEKMVAHRPTLVLRLNVSLPVAIARKPDHRVTSLARKIADVPQLSFAGAPVVEIDAEQPLQSVIASARAAIVEYLSACPIDTGQQGLAQS